MQKEPTSKNRSRWRKRATTSIKESDFAFFEIKRRKNCS